MASSPRSLSCSNSAGIHSVSPEILTQILSQLPAKSIFNVSETCKSFKEIIFDCDVLWKELCKKHFFLDLKLKEPFSSYFEIYKFIYKFKEVFLIEADSGGFSQLQFVYHWGTLIFNPNIEYYNDCYWDLRLHDDLAIFNHSLEFKLERSKLRETWGITKDDYSKTRVKDDEDDDDNDDNDDDGDDEEEWHVDMYREFKSLVMKLNGNMYNVQKLVLQKCYQDRENIDYHFKTACIALRAKSYRELVNQWHAQLKQGLLSNKSLIDPLTDDELEAIDEGRCILSLECDSPTSDEETINLFSNKILSDSPANDAETMDMIFRYALLENTPEEIGLDYILGKFNRTGLRQVREYCLFMDRLRNERAFYCGPYTIETKLICHVAMRVYSEHKEECKRRLIKAEEFWNYATEFLERGKVLTDLRYKAFCSRLKGGHQDDNSAKQRGESQAQRLEHIMKYILHGDMDAFSAIKL